jgi:O-antigen ligase
MTMCKRFLATSIFVSSAFVDGPSYWSTGSISLMGVLTAVYAIAMAGLLLTRPAALARALARIWPLSALFLFSASQLFWRPFSTEAAQTLCMQWVFLGSIVLMVSGETEGVDEATVGKMLRNAALFASLCYLVVFLFFGFGKEGIGVISFIAARSFALFALLGVALFVSEWDKSSRSGFWLGAALVLLIALSLSRTALVISILLFPLSRMRSVSFRDFGRVAIFGAMACAALLYLVFSIGALRTRFLADNAISDYVSGEAAVDTSGRLTAWAVTLNSYVDSPWTGQGPGSANDLMDDVLYRLDIGHPLNEYLRFLHDEGALGLSLLVIGFAQLLILCWRAYRNSLLLVSRRSAFYLAAFLSLVAVLLSMFTDNTASYIYVMAPLGIMVGITLRSLLSPEPMQAATALAQRKPNIELGLANS